jgi:hypothetical protein
MEPLYEQNRRFTGSDFDTLFKGLMNNRPLALIKRNHLPGETNMDNNLRELIMKRA